MAIELPNQSTTWTLYTQKSYGTYDVDVAVVKLPAPLLRVLRDMVDKVARGLGPAGQDEEVSDEAFELLPLKNEVWLQGVFSPPLWIHDHLVPQRAVVHLTMDSQKGVIVQSQVAEDAPSIDQIADNDACPTISRYHDYETLVPVKLEDLQVLMTVLPAIPQFFAAEGDEQFVIKQHGQTTRFRWQASD